MRTIWPDPYVAAYPHLLGEAVEAYDETRQVMVRRYPFSNFTPATIAAAHAARLGEIATWCAQRMEDLQRTARDHPAALLDFDLTPPAARDVAS